MSLDLADFDALVTTQEEGVDIAIEHPKTGDPLGVTIRVAGPDSARARAARRKFLDRRISNKRKPKQTAEDLEAEGLRLLASCVIEWDGVLVDGEYLECTTANVVALFERFPFIKDQIDEVVGDRSAFFANASESSGTS